jgi:hypothetical protein
MRNFIRLSTLLSATILAAASPLAAAPGGPPIAYVLASGQTNDLYLSNADGSGKVKLYTSGNKVGIIQVDIRPGGNQLAIVEQSVAGGRGTLKIINYSDAGVRQSVVTVNSGPSCEVNGVDYHPADGSLLVSRHCPSSITDVVRYAGGAYDSTPLVSYTTDFFGGKVRWAGDGGSFLWAVGDSNGGRIEHYDLNNTSAPVTVFGSNTGSAPNYFDVQRCGIAPSCDRMLATSGSGVEIHEVVFTGGGTDLGTRYASASDGHYSPDNAHVLWKQQLKTGTNLMIDGKIFVKGGGGAKDWRQ